MPGKQPIIHYPYTKTCNKRCPVENQEEKEPSLGQKEISLIGTAHAIAIVGSEGRAS